jgi:hypothetical protein
VSQERVAVGPDRIGRQDVVRGVEDVGPILEEQTVAALAGGDGVDLDRQSDAASRQTSAARLPSEAYDLLLDGRRA